MTTRRGTTRERILRVLLNESSDSLTKYRLSKKAGASYSWTHEFLKNLEADGYIQDTKIQDFRGLIKHWTRIRKKPDRREYLIQRPLQLLHSTHLEYALTTYQAETLIQGYLFPSRIDLYIKQKEKEDWHRLLSGTGLVGSGNVRLLFDDDHTLYKSREIDGLWTVSPPQLIVDLLMEGGVCVEAAELLLDKMEGKNV